MRINSRCFPLLLAAVAAVGNAQVITAVAGTGTQSFNGDGGPAINAWISMPSGIAFDGSGNLYFVDRGNFRVREINTAGTITTVAGNGLATFGGSGDNGAAMSAEFAWTPAAYLGVAVDASGNLYVADGSIGIGKVRKVNTAGIITTVAGGAVGSTGDGGLATSAGLNSVAGLAIDKQGNLYIADPTGQRVRKVNAAGVISTVAGTGVVGYSGTGGPATSAPLNVPMGLALDAQGDLYIAEGGNALYGPRVRKVDTAGNITTVAGNGTIGFSGDGGPAVSAQLGGGLQGIAIDAAGNLYIADYSNYRVRKVDASGIITTIAGNGVTGGPATSGNGGLASNSRITPAGMALDGSGNLNISDNASSQIRKIAFGATPPGLAASLTSMYFAAPTAHNATPQPEMFTVSSTGPALTFSVTTSTTAGGAWLSTSTSGTTPQTMQVSINNVNSAGVALAAATYHGTITVTPTTPGYTTPITVAVTLVISASVPAVAPVISASGVVSGGSFQTGPGIASNSYVTILGTNLASTTDTWNNSITGGQLPTSLDGVTVTFYDTPGYISYISPTQINVLAPQMALGSTSVQVINNGALGTSSTATVGVSQAAPAFFTVSGNQVIATRQDYTYALKNGTIAGVTTIPAKPGDVLILWGTGFGPTTPATPQGAVTPSDQVYSTSTPVTVTINNVAATVYGAALAPGFAGLFQVAIQVPASIANGDWPLVATIDGFSSPSTVILSVHN
jgi:uncharacterized protein (TIGR03437 family)